MCLAFCLLRESYFIKQVKHNIKNRPRTTFVNFRDCLATVL